MRAREGKVFRHGRGKHSDPPNRKQPKRALSCKCAYDRLGATHTVESGECAGRRSWLTKTSPPASSIADRNPPSSSPPPPLAPDAESATAARPSPRICGIFPIFQCAGIESSNKFARQGRRAQPREHSQAQLRPASQLRPKYSRSLQLYMTCTREIEGRKEHRKCACTLSKPIEPAGRS